MPVKQLSPGEKRLISVLLRSETVKEGTPFTSAEAWDIIKDIPTDEKLARKISSIPNKYKLTHLLKKCDGFARYRSGNGTSVWVYSGDSNAS